ncbi:MAG: DUF2807 domain-containing protein [Bacteroidales bacterium]|nr:DUF2807 domain-containing protein [Bacteroidales bacterium]
MKRLLFTLCVIITTLFGSICIASASSVEYIKANNDYITKTVNLNEFSKLKLMGYYTVEYRQSNSESCRAEIFAPSNIMEYIVCESNNGELLIKTKDKISINFQNNDKTKIVVWSKNLNSGCLIGSGDLYLNDLTGDNLSVKLQGSGDVIVKSIKENSNTDIILQGSGDIVVDNILTGDLLNFTLFGSGDIKIGSAKASQIKSNLQGSGDIKCDYLEAKNAEASLMGSGDFYISKFQTGESLDLSLKGSGDLSVKSIKTNLLKASLTGSGDIYLSGNANIARYSVVSSGTISAPNLKSDDVTATINGSGDISCHADKKLSGNVTGSGDIVYSGNASVSGTLKKISKR